MDRIQARYGMALGTYYPDMAQVASMVADHGFHLFDKSEDFRRLYCDIRNLEPLERAQDDWVSRLRIIESLDSIKAASEKSR
jgi:3'-phosphoadenosine 5'-phosphosulfate sulfotransferase (PAPS reductase)/FAD synthetase